MKTKGIDDRIRDVAEWVLRGYLVVDMVNLTMRKWDVKRATADRYIRSARKMILAELGLTRKEHQARTLAWYLSVIQDPGHEIQVKLQAQKEITRLLGLADRQPIVVKGEHSHTVQVEYSQDWRKGLTLEIDGARN
jgi:hypothetical protein